MGFDGQTGRFPSRGWRNVGWVGGAGVVMVDLDSFSAELRAVVTDTMQPAHMSLWLRAPAEAAR